MSVTPNVAGAVQTAVDIASAINDPTSQASQLVEAVAAAGQVNLTALNIGGDKIAINISSDTGNLLEILQTGRTPDLVELMVKQGCQEVRYCCMVNGGGTYGTATETPIGTFNFLTVRRI